jgi:hypothetical protein
VILALSSNVGVLIVLVVVFFLLMVVDVGSSNGCGI